MKSVLALVPLAVLATAQLHYDEQQPLASQPLVGTTFNAGPLSVDDIPLLGFGTWNLKENCTEAVSHAIQQGYRHIDCAAAYGNEFQVQLSQAWNL